MCTIDYGTPGQCLFIIWTNAGILLIGTLGTNFGGILIEIYKIAVKKMYFKLSFAKWRPFCFGLNVSWLKIKFKITVWYKHHTRLNTVTFTNITHTLVTVWIHIRLKSHCSKVIVLMQIFADNTFHIISHKPIHPPRTTFLNLSNNGV